MKVSGRTGNTLPRVLFVGAFPPAYRRIVGGNVTDCRLLMKSRFPTLVQLRTLDSTQLSNPPPGLFVRSVYAFRRLWSYIVSLCRDRPDVVLAFSSAGFSLLEKGLMGWIARCCRAKVLLFPRGGKVIDDFRRSSLNRTWIRFSMGSADRVLCQGSVWQDFCISQLHLDAASAPIVSNWTATENHLAVGRDRFARSGGRNAASKELLFVGWIEESKGVHELLQVFSVLRHHYDVHLSFAGSGKAEPALRDRVSQLSLSNRVMFHGWKAPEQLIALYRQAHVFVLPSWYEGMPNSLIEAMACGLASVVTDVGNVRDAVEHGTNGLLVRQQDTDALYVALDTLLNDDGFRLRLGHAAFEKAAKEYSVDKAVDSLVRHISELSSPELTITER